MQKVVKWVIFSKKENNVKQNKRIGLCFLFVMINVLFFPYGSYGMELNAGTANIDDIYSVLKQKVEGIQPEALKVRRHLHEFPEPCFKENDTSKYIAQYLRKLGLEVTEGIAGTGIKAVLKGTKPGKTIGIRADMDALPITENTGLEFQSKNNGFMHACGHDVHMTNGLMSARILSEMKDKIHGTIVFIFQPCEEGTPDGSPSGADRMIAEGILENPKIESMLGLHVMPDYPVGTVALREGPLMANVASIFISIIGKASHGALPHQGVDAIYAASMAVVQFQALISRMKDPNERAVLTIGKMNGGVRLNVIADRVDMEGTVRTFSFEVQNMIRNGIENILKGLQLSMGITYDYRFENSSLFVKNDVKMTEMVLGLFKKILGESNVIITEPMTIGEDFSAYSHKIPSLFFFLGVGTKGKTMEKIHSPGFSPDEKALYYGPLLLTSAAFEMLDAGH